ncbi:MAG TPA: hypothetical protein VMW09_07060 [Desulfatiglandales bacterium]|nr:hypothetical protein [Desulfatiglandales bacterium]
MIQSVILFLLIQCSPMSALATMFQGLPATADKIQFKLQSNDTNFILQIISNNDHKLIAIPNIWLIPLRDDENSYVSSLNYDKNVTSFQIGKSKIGIHISSYEIQKQGSAQASAGRDVFLVYDMKNNQIHPGIIDLGITKERYRSMGIFSSSNSKFLISDINHDGLRDIGIIKEVFKCTPLLYQSNISDDDMLPYEQYPIQWYIFDKNFWKYHERFDGNLALIEHKELPLIGLVKSPVDFVKEMCLHNQILIKDYSDFGTQAMCYDLIGYQRYQWNNDGNPDPRKEYNIQVVVYKDIDLVKVKKIYPVSKIMKRDYRYVEHNKALEYLDKQIKQIKELKKIASAQKKDVVFGQLLIRLQNTKKEIVTNLKQH